MTSSDTQGGRGSSKFIWLAIGIILAIAAYTAGWFYVGGMIEQNVDQTLYRASGEGGQAQCSNREARGYPFRIGLFCDRVSFVDGREDIAVEGNGFRTAAQIYNPYRIVGEMDDIKLRLSKERGGFGATGQGVRFSASLDEPLPQRASMTLEDLNVDTTPIGQSGWTVLKALAGEAHMRQREGDLDLFVQARSLRVTPPELGGIDLSRVEVDMTVEEGVRLAEAPPGSLRGISFVVRSASAFFTDEAGISVSGPVSIGPDGLIDAKLEVEMDRPAEVGEILAAALPDQADQIRSVMAGFAMLGNASLPLRIEKGRARIAFIQLGRLPAVN
ncbi:DUF2125 domain-containing protein [Aquibium sp. ELW1220]|uniref:DUF2125 domain-containing protein n=1 Tax=Aquibium sp. ELW1220 TaxID=2976766 RepID=UPI0025AF52CD|nr:DUF2125 domain-containing protein [Aquibium sp. ELW1220]MDN2579772.1 DUF2125 domain-containing protein [Aquibium sp. ELW1220]